MTRSIGLLYSHRKKVAKENKNGTVIHICCLDICCSGQPYLPDHSASMEVHRTGASHALIATSFAVSITPVVKSSNATTKVMPHLTNAGLSQKPPVNLSNASSLRLSNVVAQPVYQR